MKRLVNLLLMLCAVGFINAQESVNPIPDYTMNSYPGVGCEFTAKGENPGERTYTDGTQMMFTEFPATAKNDFVNVRDFDRIDGTIAGEVGVVVGYNKTGNTDGGGMEVYTDKTTTFAQLRFNGGADVWRGTGQWAFYTVQFPEAITYDFHVGIRSNQNFGFAIYKKQSNGKLSVVTPLKEKSVNDDCKMSGEWKGDAAVYLVNDEAITVSNTNDEYVVLLVSGDATGAIGATNGQFGGFAFIKQVADTKPMIELTAPLNNSNSAAAATIDLSATVTAAEGTSISAVDFLINGESYGGTPTQAGDVWSGTYQLTADGAYTVQATTTNDKGETVTTEKTVVTVGTDYPFYSYFAGPVDTAFIALDNLTEADLIDKWNESYMCNTECFDKVSADTASVDEDAGVTFINGENTSPVSFAGHPREVIETSVITSIGYNGNPASVENTLGATFYYTVEFAKAGEYQLAVRTRGGAGSKFAASLMEYKEINNSQEVVNLDFNTMGISVASANGDKDTTTMKSSYIGMAKTVNVENTQANSIWVRVATPIVIDAAATGKYLLRVSHLEGGNTSSFAGFTFLPSNGASAISESVAVCDKVYSANRKVVVELPDATKSQVSVYSLSGRCVYTDMFNASRIVSDKSFSQGVYLVKVTTEKSQATYKIVVP